MEPKTVFFKTKTSKRGNFYVASNFAGVDGEVKGAIGADGTLSLTVGEATDLIAPKENQYGQYYIVKLGGSRYFVSERENAKGVYLMAKPAPERTDNAGRPERPAQYGGRQDA